MAQIIDTETLPELVVNKVPSKAVFDDMVDQGQVNPDEMYLVVEDTKAEDVVYDPTETYTSGTVGAKLSELATDIGDMSNLDTTATNLVGAVNEVKGSLNDKVDERATAISSLNELGDDSLFFVATDDIAIGSTGVTIPQYSRGVYINYNSNEAGLLAVTIDGDLIWAYRLSGTWTEADSSANVYTTITNSNPFLERTSNATNVDLTANSYTQLTATSLEAGTWLINVNTWLSDTGTDFYNSNISSNYGNATCIFPAYNGGSNNNTMIVTFPSTQTVTVNVFYARAIKASCELTAIRLSK